MTRDVVHVTSGDRPEHTQAYDDEISLIDLWLVLMRRRKIIIGMVVASVLAGTLFALLKPEQYRYVTSIELGKLDEKLFQDPATVLAKLQDGYIPQVYENMAAASPDQLLLELTARIPKDSQIIVLESQGDQRYADQHARMHQAVVDRLVEDHERIHRTQQFQLDTDKLALQNTIAALDKKHESLQAELARLADKKKLYQERLTETRHSSEILQKTRVDILGRSREEMSAIALMMVDNQLHELQDEKSRLQEYLLLKLPQEREALQRQLAENARKHQEQDMALKSLGLKMQALTPTRALVVGLQSRHPVGAGKAVIVALSVVLGLMVGVFLAFFRDFLARAREQQVVTEGARSAAEAPDGEELPDKPRIVRGI